MWVILPRSRALAVAAMVSLAGQAQEAFESRLAAIDGTLTRFYRGERLDEAVERAKRRISTYNERARTLQSEADGKKLQVEHLAEIGRDLRRGLEALEKELQDLPPGLGTHKRRQLLERRSAQVRKINEHAARLRPAVEAYESAVRRMHELLESEREQSSAAQKEVNARIAAFEAFTKAGEDIAFFAELNRMLAEVRNRQRGGDASLEGILHRIRAYRRELAAWAMEGHARRPNGLVVVEARLGDEPCWLIVDTGATDTILSEEMVDAIGCRASLGGTTSLSVIGGLRVNGSAFRIPELLVAGQVRKDVPAAAVRLPDVGIDGLLGQSFLKGFVYTIDERRSEKVSLVPR